jgi:hypothetical protein
MENALKFISETNLKLVFLLNVMKKKGKHGFKVDFVVSFCTFPTALSLSKEVSIFSFSKAWCFSCNTRRVGS